MSESDCSCESPRSAPRGVQPRRSVRVRRRRGARPRGRRLRRRPPHLRRARRARDPPRARARATPASAPATTSALYLRNSVEHLEAMLACYKAARRPDQRQLPLRRRRARSTSRRRRPRRPVPRRRHRPRTSRAVRAPRRLRARRSPARRRTKPLVRVRLGRTRPRSALARRPLRALHRRHDRPAQGRGVAPGGHLLRRDSAAGTRAVRRSTAPEQIARVGARQPRAAAAAVPPARRPGPDAVRVARARAADARERAVVGARHAARRRQGRALRPTRTSTWSTCSTSSSASASTRCNLVGDASARPLLARARRRIPGAGTRRRCGCSVRAAASSRAT